MTKLYYSLSSFQGVSAFLAAHVSSVYFDCEAVLYEGEGMDMKTASGLDYQKISPESKLPCLVFDDGNFITQEQVILEYIADKVTGRKASHYGTKSRYEVTQFISEVTATLSSIADEFSAPNHIAEVKEQCNDGLNRSLEDLDRDFHQRCSKYAVGDEFTIADAYLLSMLLWLNSMKFDLGPYPALHKHYDDMMTRPDIKSALDRIHNSPTSTIDLTSAKCTWISCSLL